MKRIFEFLTGLAALAAVSSTALAQTAQDHVASATAKAQNAVAATGLPIWVWIAIAVVLLAAIIFALARRRRSTQAVITTRLG